MSPAFGHYFNSTNKTFLVSSVMSSFNAQTVEQKEKELSKKKIIKVLHNYLWSIQHIKYDTQIDSWKTQSFSSNISSDHQNIKFCWFKGLLNLWCCN